MTQRCWIPDGLCMYIFTSLIFHNSCFFPGPKKAAVHLPSLWPERDSSMIGKASPLDFQTTADVCLFQPLIYFV